MGLFNHFQHEENHVLGQRLIIMYLIYG